MRAALDELLDTARLPTLQKWFEFATEAGLESGVLSVARAEVALRYGRHVEAMAHAEAAAGKDSELAFRALYVAGRAAHLASREEDALELYRRAEAAASTEVSAATPGGVSSCAPLNSSCLTLVSHYAHSTRGCI